jgi:hypothetical protein
MRNLDGLSIYYEGDLRHTNSPLESRMPTGYWLTWPVSVVPMPPRFTLIRVSQRLLMDAERCGFEYRTISD